MNAEKRLETYSGPVARFHFAMAGPYSEVCNIYRKVLAVAPIHLLRRHCRMRGFGVVLRILDQRLVQHLDRPGHLGLVDHHLHLDPAGALLHRDGVDIRPIQRIQRAAHHTEAGQIAADHRHQRKVACRDLGGGEALGQIAFRPADGLERSVKPMGDAVGVGRLGHDPDVMPRQRVQNGRIIGVN